MFRWRTRRDVTPEQVEVCRRFDVAPVAAPRSVNCGVSRSMLGRAAAPMRWPIQGVRHAVEGSTTGWYLWTGEYSEAADFYLPWHTAHLQDAWPEVVPYLALPPGWGFVLAPGYEDVWFDPQRAAS